jgi:hypothetical protein
LDGAKKEDGDVDARNGLPRQVDVNIQENDLLVDLGRGKLKSPQNLFY